MFLCYTQGMGKLSKLRKDILKNPNPWKRSYYKDVWMKRDKITGERKFEPKWYYYHRNAYRKFVEKVLRELDDSRGMVGLSDVGLEVGWE